MLVSDGMKFMFGVIIIREFFFFLLVFADVRLMLCSNQQ